MFFKSLLSAADSFGFLKGSGGGKGSLTRGKGSGVVAIVGAGADAGAGGFLLKVARAAVANNCLRFTRSLNRWT